MPSPAHPVAATTIESSTALLGPVAPPTSLAAPLGVLDGLQPQPSGLDTLAVGCAAVGLLVAWLAWIVWRRPRAERLYAVTVGVLVLVPCGFVFGEWLAGVRYSYGMIPRFPLWPLAVVGLTLLWPDRRSSTTRPRFRSLLLRTAAGIVGCFSLAAIVAGLAPIRPVPLAIGAVLALVSLALVRIALWRPKLQRPAGFLIGVGLIVPGIRGAMLAVEDAPGPFTLDGSWEFCLFGGALGLVLVLTGACLVWATSRRSEPAVPG